MAKRQKLPDAFPAAICQRLRKISALRSKAINKKKEATEWRNDIEKQIAECTDGEVKKTERLKSDYYDAVHEIDRWDSCIKVCNNRMVGTIDAGDQLELIPTLNPNPTEKSLMAEGQRIGGGDDEADEDDDEEGADDAQKRRNADVESDEPVGAAAD